ncbi:TonB-dependent receptor [Paludibacter sp.]
MTQKSRKTNCLLHFKCNLLRKRYIKSRICVALTIFTFLAHSLIATSSSVNESLTFSSNSYINNLETLQQSNIISVNGVVKDGLGEPLIGVTIKIKGTQEGLITDNKGTFSISLPANSVLTFSSVGYISKDIAIKTDNSALIVVLQEDVHELSDVVVTGYSSQSRRNLSASVAKIDVSVFKENTSSSILNLLAGQVAGMQTITRGGTPGAGGGGVVIRGNTSLSADDGLSGISNPLYIVDGIPMSLQDIAGFDVSQNDFLASLNPSDIESINILKDAAATSIYGSRGANGVIIITTKRGSTGKARISGGVTSGVTMQPEKMKVFIGEAERQEKLRLWEKSFNTLFGEGNEWIDVRNGLELMGYIQPSVLTDKYNPFFNNAYDYQKMFYQNGLSQNYNLSIEGGREESSYRISLDHYNEKGVLVGYGFNRTTLTTSLVNNITNKVKNDFLVRYSYLDRKGGLNDYMRALPTSPTQLPSSLFYRTDEELELLSGQLGNTYNKNETHNISFSESLKIDFTDHLSLNCQASVSLMFADNNYFIPSTARADRKTYGQARSSMNSIMNSNSVLNYRNNFGDHSVVGLLGVEVNMDRQQQSWIIAENGTSDYLKVIQGYQKESIDGYSDVIKTNMLSYFGLVSYGYMMNRYKVEAVLRRDGSSRFGANNRWATFPSVKVHWIFSNEPWIKDYAAEWFDFGKIRVSYGSSGSIANDPLLQYNSFITPKNIGTGMNDIYSNKIEVKTYGGQSLLLSDFNKVANRNLSWSKSNEINYGLDLEFFDRRIVFTGDIYSRYISGLIYRSELPTHFGFNSLESNLVDMLSNGFEINLTAYAFPHNKDFQWSWTVNFSRNSTIIARLGNGGRDYISGDYAFVVGRPAFQYYMQEYVGALDSFDDLPVNPMDGQALKYTGTDAGLALGLQGRIFPGMPLFTDVNGDYLIGFEEDKKIIENKSPEPKLLGGLHTNIKYKNLSLRLQTSFAFGHWIYNTTLNDQLSIFDSEKYFISALYKFDENVFWQKPGDKSKYPMMYITYWDGGTARAFRRSSMFLEPGDYWSLDNVTLSYNLPRSVITFLNLNRVNVYATANNVVMLKKSGVFDPRMLSKTGFYNGNGYPISRNFIFGLQFQF